MSNPNGLLSQKVCRFCEWHIIECRTFNGLLWS